jgi:hypothetical protein
MPSLDKAAILAAICPPLDNRLAEQLFDEFVSLERRYVLREWEPATLDGGQFAEAASRLIYHQYSSTLNRRKSVHDCLSYVEDHNSSNPHHFPDRKAALHLAKVIRTIYKFRSDRGAVHIDPDYTANHLDSKLVLELPLGVIRNPAAFLDCGSSLGGPCYSANCPIRRSLHWCF